MGYPVLKTSASLSKAELIRIGNGYFSKSLGKRTMASHCSPILTERNPENLCKNRELVTHKFYFNAVKFKWKLPTS